MSAGTRRGAAGWFDDLALGVRLSVAGGRSGWARLTLISVGVGLGVVLLLTVAALPTLAAARGEREAARLPGPVVSASGPDTLLTVDVESRYRGTDVNGWLVRPEGERTPLPPGVDRRLAPGEMVVSPALAELLDSPEGALLRERWGGRVVGTIGADGLAGPGERLFYLGSEQVDEETPGARRIDAYGGDGRQESAGVTPVLLVLGVLGLVVLLLPVMIFVTTAVRFGSAARDRQLAAIRLVGADSAMTRRVAAGESLVGAVLGLALGALAFLGVRGVAGDLLPPGFSFFTVDLRPVPGLALLVVVLVPTVAVLVTLSALRQVVIEPLGVVRRGGERHRRFWWRPLPSLVGLLLLYPLLGGLTEQAGGLLVELQLAAGATLLLVGVVLLLPWLVQATVRRLGGGGVAWQLAVRRLQLYSDTAVRAVSGIAVSVAGVIAVQGVLGAAQAYGASDLSPDDDFQAVVYVYEQGTPDGPARTWAEALAETVGVRAASGLADLGTAPDAAQVHRVYVADCAALRQYAELPSCADGDSFAGPGGASTEAGTTLTFDDGGTPIRWTVPTGVPTVRQYSTMVVADFLLTPGALQVPPVNPGTVLVAYDSADRDAVERLRNTVAQVDPTAVVQTFEERRTSSVLAGYQQALQIGAVVLLLVIGASMLVNILEQLRERWRPLAVLSAFGVRRRSLSGAVLYQVAIPVTLGMLLAVVTGSAVAALLQSVAGISVGVNWAAIAGVSGTAAVLVLVVTAASLPLLWRLTRAEGLRSE
ncbi:FtsX-like permease family protein [Verrucosispora sp. TAA-831]|uniref:FtsX-like permease family protein n=1 Tax=Verrucosispora sp. TAA-831 TaxID=3422227 RepID=UPI003D6E0201